MTQHHQFKPWQHSSTLEFDQKYGLLRIAQPKRRLIAERSATHQQRVEGWRHSDARQVNDHHHCGGQP
jgi:hypothetical protein